MLIAALKISACGRKMTIIMNFWKLCCQPFWIWLKFKNAGWALRKHPNLISNPPMSTFLNLAKIKKRVMGIEKTPKSHIQPIRANLWQYQGSHLAQCSLVRKKHEFRSKWPPSTGWIWWNYQNCDEMCFFPSQPTIQALVFISQVDSSFKN